jgi:peptidoglycan/xylan/chitin deacetylase (PgdA/CDA1 family)
VKRLVLRVMQGFGMFAMARMMSASSARILMYHNFCGPDEAGTDEVSAAALRIQLEILGSQFQVVTLGRLLERLESGEQLDRHTVVLTIDDGRRNCYEHLFPLLKEFEVPATFFVVTSFIRREDWLWTDKLLWLSEQPARPTELAGGRIEALFAALNRLQPTVRNAHILAIAENMRISIPKEAPNKYAPCSWSELREMADSGLVEIGSHSVTHPILSSITDEESWSELTASRTQIEEGLGRKITSFCFPNGKAGDYRPSQVRQVKDAGYECAVVTRSGMVGQRANPYELPRIGISGETDALSFSKYLDGAEYFQARLRNLCRPRSAQPW